MHAGVHVISNQSVSVAYQRITASGPVHLLLCVEVCKSCKADMRPKLGLSTQYLVHLSQQGRDLAQQVAERPILCVCAAVIPCVVLACRHMCRRRGIEGPPWRSPRP